MLNTKSKGTKVGRGSSWSEFIRDLDTSTLNIYEQSVTE